MKRPAACKAAKAKPRSLATMKRPAACKAAKAKPRSLATMKRPAAFLAAKAKPRSPASKIVLPGGQLTALGHYPIHHRSWNKDCYLKPVCGHDNEKNLWGDIWVNFDNKQFALHISAEHTIEDLKFEIWDMYGINEWEQNHVYIYLSLIHI